MERPEGGLVSHTLAVHELEVALGRRTILHPTTFEVADSSFMALVGPNGAGKTTLLRALAGLVPSGGDVTVGGRPLASLSTRDRARHVAYVPQHPLIPAAMTVAEYVLLGRTPHIGHFAVESHTDRAAASEAVRALDLTGLRDRPVADLSGGERQRAVLARAAAQQSPVLLLDEPTTALDLGHQHQVLELIDGLRRDLGLVVIAAVHDLTLASHYATRILVLADGDVVADGSAVDVVTAENLARYWGVEARVLAGAGGSVHVLSERAGLSRGVVTHA
jgi:iron complex transport system ATP-binding protein